MGIALLVVIHIGFTQKWAAQRSAPLRSGDTQSEDMFINWKGFLVRYFISSALLVGL